MSGPQLRNLEGKLITRTGRLDLRAKGTPHTTSIPDAPDCVYDVLHKPQDARPWHVVESRLSDGAKRRVSRHAGKRTAMKRAELERLKQPNRVQTVKALHKAGVDQRNR